jgi:hypothetical protein
MAEHVTVTHRFVARPETRLSYRAVRSVAPRGDFVFLQQHGVPVVAVYPRELFPDDAIARIRAHTTKG